MVVIVSLVGISLIFAIITQVSLITKILGAWPTNKSQNYWRRPTRHLELKVKIFGGHRHRLL